MYSIDGGRTYIAGPDTGYTFGNLTAGRYGLRIKDATGCEIEVVEKTVKAVCTTLTTITTFTPASGPVGTTVTISGTNFSPVAADNIVYFGAVKGSVTAASATSLTVTVPIGATYKPITVTTNGLTAYSNQPFNITFPNSSGNFSSNSFAPRIDFATGSNPNILLIGDIDGDGKPDMITATNYYTNHTDSNGPISVFRNTGFSGTVAFERIDLGFPYISGLAIGDLDGDGKLDLAVSNEKSVFVLRNKSTPGVISFEQSGLYPINSRGFGSRGVIAIADLDLDGKPDIVLPIFSLCHFDPYSNPTNSILKNVSSNGLLSFAPAVLFGSGCNFSTAGVLVTDFDGDGKPDVVGPDGTFRNISTIGTIALTRKFFGAYGISGDVDGDSKPDLAAGNIIFKNTSIAGTFSFTRIDLPDGTGGSSAIGDLDGDGKLDLVDVGGDTVFVSKNLTIGGIISFAPKINYPAGSGGPSAIADFDGDGKPDIAVANTSSNTISILRNQIPSILNCVPPTFLNNDQTVVNATCGRSTGSISIVPASGTAPFMYSINGGATYVAGPDNGYTFSNLAAGTYKLRMKDATGCESAIVEKTITSVDINCPVCTPTTFLNNGQIVLDATCGKNDGNISIISTSGTAPFLYSINGGTSYVSGPNAGYTFNNLGAGTYRLKLKDANNCESAVVERMVKTTGGPTFLNNSQIVLDATCGKNDGNISIIPTSGNAPFVYSIDGGITYVNGPNGGYTFNNLAPGIYKLRLADAIGCESAIVEKAVNQSKDCPLMTIVPSPGYTTGVAEIPMAKSEVVLTYPNPTKGQFRLQLQNFISTKAEVSIFDAKGTLIEKRLINVTPNATANFDLSQKAKGLYFIKILSSNRTKVSKVVIE